MKFLATILALGAIGAVIACSSDDNSGSTPTKATATTTPAASSVATTNAVDVSVQEWSIIPSVDSAKAGPVTFNVQNIGPKEEHEFVVLKTDLAADALPKLADGSVDEQGAGISSPGEIEGMGAGEHKSATFNLQPGKYMFICNLIDQGDGGVEVHFKEGMFASFTVQ